MLTTKISQKSGILERTSIKPILKIFRAENIHGPYHPLNMNNDDISHFSTIPVSFCNVYFLTHQYLIINNSQSQRALSVSVRTVLYFASRRNCGLLPGAKLNYWRWPAPRTTDCSRPQTGISVLFFSSLCKRNCAVIRETY